jgi:hypothetical protein
MERDRSWRRNQSKRVQTKRYEDMEPNNKTNWLDSANNYGKLKKGHFGCGCANCKPHKFGLANELPHSQQKKLINKE